MDAGLFNIRDFGADVDAAPLLNRKAIQAAVDSATVNGGTVVVPAGTWCTGTIELKSNVELHLEKGAVLLGSTDRNDYNEDDIFPENPSSPSEEWSGAHLIYAYEAENIAITGEGVINGRGSSFFGDCEESSCGVWYKYGIKLHPVDSDWYRPGIMIAFFHSRNIRLEDVTFADSTSWNCHVSCSDGLVARRVKILSDRTIANTDGFSIDCTRNVLIESCIIKTADDSFAIRASSKAYASTHPCEHIRIRDCDVWSSCNGIRFGVGAGDIRDIVVDDCRFHESAITFGFTPAWIPGQRNCYISDITIRNCTCRESGTPFYCEMPESDSCVRNILVENTTFEALGNSVISGTELGVVSDILFRNCSYRRIPSLKVRNPGDQKVSCPRARDFMRVEGITSNVRAENCTPGGERPGALLLAFDDRNFEDWVNAIPLFEKYNAKATFFVCGEIDKTAVPYLKKLYRAGFSIGLHGLTHRDAPPAFAECGGEAYYSEQIAKPARQVHVALMEAPFFAYPNNARNDETDSYLCTRFVRLRAGVPGSAPYDPEGVKQEGLKPLYKNDDLFFPVSEIARHRVISGAVIGEAYHTKIGDVLKCLERAAERREVIEFTSHGIHPDAKSIHMKTEWLEAILARAQELGLEVLSFSELDNPE